MGARRGPAGRERVEAERRHLAKVDRLQDLDAWIEARAEAAADEAGEQEEPDFDESLFSPYPE